MEKTTETPTRTIGTCKASIGGCLMFADVAVMDEYHKRCDSLSEMKQFDMYYGNGTVD